MKNLLKRIKTLWRLSALEFEQEQKLAIKNGTITIEKPKMAQIVKRDSPVQEFLKKNQDE